MFNVNKPYNELPLLPPKVDFKDQDILLATIEAADAVAQLKTMLTMSKRTLGNTLDLLSPLFVPEAVSSSSVENIITTNDSVYYAKILEERELSAAEKEALNYSKALLNAGIKLIDKEFLATNDYLEMQSIIEPTTTGIRKAPGTQISNPITKVVYYTPPNGEQRIRDLLEDFEKYFNEEAPTFEVFSRMAILHYQFEAIHPFKDGNGRTGRMLMPLYLMKQNKLPLPFLFISHYILNNRDEYYLRLREVTYTENWKEWILYITEATTEQAHYTFKVLRKIKKAIENVKALLVDDLAHLHRQDLLDFIFSNVYFTQKDFEEAVGISPMTARKYLSELEKNNILKKSKQANRNRYIYINPRYIAILKQA